MQHVKRLQDGSALAVSISRDNCLPSAAFCDLQTRVCVRKKARAASCTGDWECASVSRPAPPQRRLRVLTRAAPQDNCDENAGHACGDPAAAPYKVTPAQYALTAIAIVLGAPPDCVWSAG